MIETIRHKKYKYCLSNTLQLFALFHTTYLWYLQQMHKIDQDFKRFSWRQGNRDNYVCPCHGMVVFPVDCFIAVSKWQRGQYWIWGYPDLLQLHLNDKTETDSLFVQEIRAKDFYVLCKFWPNSVFIGDW